MQELDEILNKLEELSQNVVIESEEIIFKTSVNMNHGDIGVVVEGQHLGSVVMCIRSSDQVFFNIIHNQYSSSLGGWYGDNPVWFRLLSKEEKKLLDNLLNDFSKNNIGFKPPV